MTSMTFEVGHRTTYGFRLIIATVAAALVAFVYAISRPLNLDAANGPPPPYGSQPLAAP